MFLYVGSINGNNNPVLQKKKWSVAEARPADSGSYRLTKQESAGGFLGSIRMREIFQFEVWNSSNFVIILSFVEKSAHMTIVRITFLQLHTSFLERSMDGRF